jgi:hypothetical protein
MPSVPDKPSLFSPPEWPKPDATLACGDAAFLRRACLAASGTSQIAEYNPTAAPKRVSARENAQTGGANPANGAVQHVAKTPSCRDVDRTASLRSLIVQVKCGTFAMTDRYLLSRAQQQSRKLKRKVKP